MSNIQIVATIVPEEKILNDKSLDKRLKLLIDSINAELPEYKRVNKFIIKREEFQKTTTLKIKRRAK